MSKLFQLFSKCSANKVMNYPSRCSIALRRPFSSSVADRPKEVYDRAMKWLERIDQADPAHRPALMVELIFTEEDVGERRYRKAYWEEQFMNEKADKAYREEHANGLQRRANQELLHRMVELIRNEKEIKELVLDFYQKSDPAADAKVAKKKFDAVFKPTYKPMAELRKVVEDPTIQKVLWLRLGLTAPLPDVKGMWNGDLPPKSSYRPAHIEGIL